MQLRIVGRWIGRNLKGSCCKLIEVKSWNSRETSVRMDGTLTEVRNEPFSSTNLRVLFLDQPFLSFSTLMVEAILCSETSVNFCRTTRNIPEDYTSQSPPWEDHIQHSPIVDWLTLLLLKSTYFPVRTTGIRFRTRTLDWLWGPHNR